LGTLLLKVEWRKLMAKKLKPKHLGTGLASKAGKALKGRKSKIDRALDKAMGGSKPTKKKTRARG
jgi:Tfp pilus assembly protein PilZ